MKKLFIVIALFVITLFVIDLNATCPPGFTPGPDVIMNPCGACMVTIHWCHREHLGRPDDIFISGYELDEFLCSCLPVDANQNMKLAISEMLKAIVVQEGHEIGISDPLNDLPLCDDITPGNEVQVKVYIGKCYEKYQAEFPYTGYRYCNPLIMGECRTYYRLCIEYISLTEWRVVVQEFGSPSIQFDCDLPCFPLCQ